MKKVWHPTYDKITVPTRSTYSTREKEIYNKAIIRAANLVKSYDGLIPDEVERQVIVDAVLKLKRKIGKF